MIYKKINQKEALLLKKKLQNVCKLWLRVEGTYSSENWENFCKYCDIFVCIDCNKIVGILLVSFASTYQCDQMTECLKKHNLKPNKTIHIMMFAVDPHYRRRGIGRNLFEIMYKNNDFQNIIHYILAMREHNEVAKNFYLKQGFCDSGCKCEASYLNPTDNQIILIKIK